MTKEEQAIKYFEDKIKNVKPEYTETLVDGKLFRSEIIPIKMRFDKEDAEKMKIILNMLKEKDKEIEYLKENVDYQTLCDFLISSVVADEEPVWTEEHIEELLENFEVRWKNAYK